MTAPTTHWSTTGRLHTGTVDGCGACDDACGCYACIGDKPVREGDWLTIGMTRMILCAECGNKRCPHSTDHRNACTGSNEPGQAGSRYPAPRPLDPIRDGRTPAERGRAFLASLPPDDDACGKASLRPVAAPLAPEQAQRTVRDPHDAQEGAQ